jgi:inorganic pyrophosphatase
MSTYSIDKDGAPGSTSYRVFIKQDGQIISPFHDILLRAKKGVPDIVNMVVEIPKTTQAKMEINKKEKFNPIAQDIKDGKLRVVGMPYPAHYGALPQTWENPMFVDPYTKCKGDNDPVDVYDISSLPAETGEVIQVRILGVFGMIDNNETDWKVISINIKDPNADKINDINDIPEEQMTTLFTFLRDYKIPDGKPPNKFAFDSKPQDKAFALKIMNETHEEWKKLMNHVTTNPDINLTSRFFTSIFYNKTEEPPIFKIVLTGGPCGGKSTALSQLTAFLRPLGYEVFMVPEVATILFTGGAKYSANMLQGQLVAFQSAIVKSMITLEDSFYDIALSLGKPSVIICDRGTMDCAAYTDPATWQLMLDTNKWTNESLRDMRYDAVVHLVTAAQGAEAFYTTENNVVRREKPEEARILDLALQKAWLGHSHVCLLDNSTNFTQKIQRCISFISKIIGAPFPSGTVRKWRLIESPKIPADISVVEYTLEQTYLVGDQNVESRIERKTTNNNNTYIISRKRWSPDRDTFAIVERIIFPREYMALRSQADHNRIPVQKLVKKFFWNQQVLSVIEYINPMIDAIKFVQLETEDVDMKFTFPNWLPHAEEVTDDPKFSSYNISKDYKK